MPFPLTFMPSVISNGIPLQLKTRLSKAINKLEAEESERQEVTGDLSKVGRT